MSRRSMGGITADQEAIAQFISTHAHTGSIHAANYRKVAQEENVKRQMEKTDQMSAIRTEVGTSIAQIATCLRTEINKGYNASKTEIQTMGDNMKTLAEAHGSLKDDVAFVRHELNRIGEQMTALNHLVTNRNKEVLVRIENLEREVTRLLTPPPKKTVHWVELLVTTGVLLLAVTVYYVQMKPTLPMIGY